MTACFSTALAVTLATLTSAHTQTQPPQPKTFEAAEFVRGLYVRYTGAEPPRAIVDTWLRELQKGTTPAEVHAQVLGSAETFDRVNKDYDAWVRMLYGEILGREPEPSGLANWQTRLRENKWDRVKVAREFLQSAGAELARGGANRPAAVDPADLPEHLKATAALLSQTVAGEFPGYGNFVVRSQAEAFARSAAAYQQVLRDPNRFPGKHKEAVADLSAALDALERSVAQARLPAQSTRLHLDQTRQLLTALAGEAPPPGPLPAADARKIRRLVDALGKDVTAAEATFRAIVPQAWNTTRLLNSVAGFSADVDDLRPFARGGKRSDLAARVQELNASAAAISNTVASGKVDVRAAQSWYAVTASLKAVTDEVGEVVAPPPGGGASAEVLQAIDRAAAECDALALSYSPYTTYHRGVARLVADLQDLKNRYAALRKVVGGRNPARRDLDAHLQGIEERLTSVGTNWREVRKDRRVADAPDLIDLTAADRDVTKLIAAIK